MIIRTNTVLCFLFFVVFFFISNGWRFRQATHLILRILATVIIINHAQNVFFPDVLLVSLETGSLGVKSKEKLC